ncbi:helix-turn-helix domain-containing protein [Candidatus Latescibacterota bacterium]
MANPLPTTASPSDGKEYVEDMRVAPAIELSTRQQEVLERLVRRSTGEQRLAERARIILACAQGGRNLDLAEDLGLDADTVGRWRRRWAAGQEQLATAEESSRRSDLDRCITQTLVDAPRAGCPGTFSPEQIVEIIAIACEHPEEDSERPVSHWTPRELAEEAVKRKIVPSISVRTVGRFLKSGES